MNLTEELAARGIDNPATIVLEHDDDAIVAAIAYWDQRRDAGIEVGAGLLVNLIRNGVPAPVTRPLSALEQARARGRLLCHACDAEYDPAKCRLRGKRIGPAAYCNACLAANLEAGRWQEADRLAAASAPPAA